MTSAVLIVGDRRERGAAALASLLAQPVGEIVLVDAAGGEHRPVAGAGDPRVRTLRLGDDVHLGKMRAAGVRAARGRFVVFLEEHARALPGWADALERRLAGPWAGVVGRPVLPSAGPVSDAAAFAGFVRYLPPAPGGETDDLVPYNGGFRRDLLLGMGDELDDLLLIELPLHRRLRAAGHRLYFEPEARFVHLGESTLTSFAGANYWFSRELGAARARQGDSRRWLVAAAAPALPILRAARVLRDVWRLRPGDRLRCLCCLPAILLGAAASVAGQLAGLLAGADPLRLTRFELDADRVADGAGREL